MKRPYLYNASAFSTRHKTRVIREGETPADPLPPSSFREESRWRYSTETGEVIASRCPRCQQWRPLNQFNKGIRTKHGLATYCKPCSVEWAVEWNKTERGKISRHRSRIWYEYQLDAKTFEIMKEAQGDRCKICRGEPENGKELCVDHCHVTNKVRGLLCDRCNRAIGYLREDPAILKTAAEYLENKGDIK
jgi:hypothetical protein